MISEYPLTRSNRIRLAQAFRNVPRVDISIECVLEDQMGFAYVDNAEQPSAYLIRIGPFHYFAGDVSGAGAQEMLKGFPRDAANMESCRLAQKLGYTSAGSYRAYYLKGQ